jgi:hypothetical protein
MGAGDSSMLVYLQHKLAEVPHHLAMLPASSILQVQLSHNLVRDVKKKSLNYIPDSNIVIFLKTSDSDLTKSTDLYQKQHIFYTSNKRFQVLHSKE